MKFEVTILGCGSATPTLRRAATAQYVNARERHFLIDCAEGTQLKLRQHKAPVQRLHAIFISHLHGDHYFGLVGLLSTMHLLGRQAPLHLYGPPGLEEILNVHWKHGRTTLRFPLCFFGLTENKTEVLYEDSQVFVRSFPLKHGIPCWGFRVEEQPLKRKINRAATDRHGVPKYKMRSVVEGNDFVNEAGVVIPNAELTFDPRPPKSYAYCSDTAYSPAIVPHISGVDLLYHEATFAEAMKVRAKETMHATARDAGRIAAQAKVNQLVIGHYSARYRNIDLLVDEAREEFSNTIGGEDGMVLQL